eukprot:5272350-Lingulodinium_polyedra.AAC.1
MPCTAHTPAAHEEDATLQVPVVVEVLDVDEEAACGAAGWPGRPRCGGRGGARAGARDGPRQSFMPP